MKVKLTFTGIDEQVSFDELEILAQLYPFIEFGVLYSTSRAGKEPRYPSYDFIRKFADFVKSDLPHTSIALHLCGEAAKKFILVDNITDPDINDIDRLIALFNRIQLNVNATQLQQQVGSNPLYCYMPSGHVNKPFIIQYNDNNYDFVNNLVLKRKHIHILKDASGGRGEFDGNFEIPWMCSKVPIGFAGGFGPDNIDTAAVKIYDSVMSQNVEGNYENKMFWIDQESKIRTNDTLDIEKCHFVADIINKLYFNSYRNLEI